MSRIAARRTVVFVGLLAFALALAACGPRVPSGKPSISGVLREISEGPGVMTVLVYGAADIERLSARVDTATVLLREIDGRIETATRSEILPGHKADVWIDGPLMESYPPQGHASTLVIHER
jgi:hypothetical protein